MCVYACVCVYVYSEGVRSAGVPYSCELSFVLVRKQIQILSNISMRFPGPMPST